MSVCNETKQAHANVPAGWRLLENPAPVEAGDLVWNCAEEKFQAPEDLRRGDVAAEYYAVIRKEVPPATSSPPRAQTWWMVLNPYPQGDKPRVQHLSLESAKAEAMRLAGKDSCKMHVLQLVGTAHPPKQPDAKWEDRA